MSEARRTESPSSLQRTSRVDKANHMNRMQSRSYMNQIEVLENNIKKKLKVIEKEKLQVTRYLRFLRSSSGVSPLSMAPEGRRDRPKVRPATAGGGGQRFRFGNSDGNANHSYMSAEPRLCWPGFGSSSQEAAMSDVRAKTACMSRSRMIEYHSTMSRIRKIEEPLRKRVSWIDGGNGGDDGIKGYSSGIRAFSQNIMKERERSGSITSQRRSSGTQYEDQNGSEVDAHSEVSSVKSSETMLSSSAQRVPSSSSARGRQVKTLKPINVMFPFPLAPDAPKRGSRSANEGARDRRKRLSASVIPITTGRKFS